MCFVKFNVDKQNRYLGLLASGMRRGEAARGAGVSRQAVFYHCQQHPEFAKKQDEAEAMACDIVEDALWKKCIEGNVTAIIFWLMNRGEPGRWKDRRGQPSTIINASGEDPHFKAILDRLNNKKEETNG